MPRVHFLPLAEDEKRMNEAPIVFVFEFRLLLPSRRSPPLSRPLFHSELKNTRAFKKMELQSEAREGGNAEVIRGVGGIRWYWH